MEECPAFGSLFSQAQGGESLPILAAAGKEGDQGDRGVGGTITDWARATSPARLSFFYVDFTRIMQGGLAFSFLSL